MTRPNIPPMSQTLAIAPARRAVSRRRRTNPPSYLSYEPGEWMPSDERDLRKAHARQAKERERQREARKAQKRREKELEMQYPHR